MRRYDHIPSNDCIHCRRCRTRVAFIQDYLLIVRVTVPGGIFSRMINVVVADDMRYHLQLNGNTLANTNCVQCGMLLGWKLIAVPQPSMHIREGRFYMRLHKLSFWDDAPLFHLNAYEENDDQDLDANEENVDQDGEANEQVPNKQDLGANEQNAHQDGVANEQVPNKQDLGANEQNAHQDGVANEQVPNKDVDMAEGMDKINLKSDIRTIR